jgi:hypothetical protein
VGTVDLATLAVTYHDQPRTPAVAEKVLSGPTRDATWLGNGLIAVTGQNGQAWLDASKGYQEIVKPAGLSVINTNTWTSQLVDPQASATVVANGLLLATGTWWNTTTGSSQLHPLGNGLTAYTTAGTQTFHTLGQAPLQQVWAANNLGYAWQLSATQECPFERREATRLALGPSQRPARDPRAEVPTRPHRSTGCAASDASVHARRRRPRRLFGRHRASDARFDLRENRQSRKCRKRAAFSAARNGWLQRARPDPAAAAPSEAPPASRASAHVCASWRALHPLSRKATGRPGRVAVQPSADRRDRLTTGDGTVFWASVRGCSFDACRGRTRACRSPRI